MVEIEGVNALEELAELIEAGERVVLTRNGQRFAEVFALPKSEKKPSILGAFEGKIPHGVVIPKWIVEDDKIVVKYPEF